MIFLQLFITFFQIGLFGFGGGYAMISLIQGQVVTRWHWIARTLAHHTFDHRARDLEELWA